MRVWFRTPYSTEKNLGKAYNEEMAMIPDGDAACFTDGDVLFLTPDFGDIITKYYQEFPTSVLTCWTNRIHQLAKGQLWPYQTGSDIKEHLQIKQGFKSAAPIDGPASGFLLVVPKSIWKVHRFTEVNKYNPEQPNLLGVDNEWTNRIRQAGVRFLRMNGVYVWHTYRLLSDGKDKSHLL